MLLPKILQLNGMTSWPPHVSYVAQKSFQLQEYHLTDSSTDYWLPRAYIGRINLALISLNWTDVILARA